MLVKCSFIQEIQLLVELFYDLYRDIIQCIVKV